MSSNLYKFTATFHTCKIHVCQPAANRKKCREFDYWTIFFSRFRFLITKILSITSVQHAAPNRPSKTACIRLGLP